MRTPKPWILPQQPTTRAMLRAGGVSDQMLETQVAAGRLQRLRHGIFLAASSWPTDLAAQHLMLARAEQAANPQAVLSHQTAALVWALPTPGFHEWYDDPPCLTLPSGTNHRVGMGAVLRTAPLRSADLTCDPFGFPVTTLARTVSDLAYELALPQALVIMDAAGRLLIQALINEPRRADYANPRLIRMVQESLQTAAPPRTLSRLKPAIEKVEPCRESPAESLTAGHLHLSGLPMPLFQAPIPSPMGTLYPDCYWPRARLVGECDGAIKYTDQMSIVKEKEREQWFRDETYGMVRWLGKEIFGQPQRVMARIAAALA
ncbi:MAG: hypothetical protein ACOH16_15005 [Propionibacteriaceae bacterium]